MKKFSIILNIVLLLVCLFFGVSANIQTGLANEFKTQAEQSKAEADKQSRLALDAAARAYQEAANAKIAQSEAVRIFDELTKCKQSK